MSLYVPPRFRDDDPAEAMALMRSHAFATLITTTAHGDPYISHLPLLLDADDALHGHMARANPHWQAFASGHTVAIFHGPHAYISPSWYADPDREVPTWNYATVHAHGAVTLIEDAAAKLELVDRSTAFFEPVAFAWTRKVEGPRLQALLAGIVAFRLQPERIEAKFKMNQNKTAADRAQVIHQLRASGHPDGLAMADWMQGHEPAEEPAT